MRVVRAAAAVVLLAIVGLWLVFLRPSFLGGDTGYIVVSGSSMRPTLRDGDLVIVREQGSYGTGDVIAFDVPEGRGPDELVIHRIVSGSAADGYVTRGDNRSAVDPWRVAPDDIVGKRIARLPFVGAVLDAAAHPFTVGLVSGALVTSLWWVLSDRPRARRGSSAPVVAATTRADAVALRIRREYEATADPVERLRIRRLAFETAATLATEQPGFEPATFLRACGTYAYDGDGTAEPESVAHQR